MSSQQEYEKNAKNLRNNMLSDLYKGRHFVIKEEEEKEEEKKEEVEQEGNGGEKDEELIKVKKKVEELRGELNELKNEQKKLKRQNNKEKKLCLFSYLKTSYEYKYPHEKKLGFPSEIDAAVIGIDIKGYSKRNWIEQAFISILIYGSINKAINCLKENGFINRDEPIIKQPTGDGAMIVFDKREKKKGYPNNAIMSSLLFILIFNILIKEYNWQEIIKTDVKGQKEDMPPIHPLYTRFSLDYGKLFLIMGIDDTLNCAGDTIVTSSRILSIDKGNHFLVSTPFINEIRCDINRFLSNTLAGDWKPKFSIIEIEPIKIKDKLFEISSIYGSYEDIPFLRLSGKSSKISTSFTIGCSDTNQIKSG